MKSTFDEFRVILAMLEFKFNIIYLSESKIQRDCDPKIDINIDGYQYPAGTPTESTKGGILIYIKKSETKTTDMAHTRSTAR